MVYQTQMPDAPVTPRFDVRGDIFVSFDGARLGLTVWGDTESSPEHVIVGIHGMNDWANAFHMAAPAWAAEGVVVYAYDQRGFGRSPGFGVWPDEESMREDFRTAVDLARTSHPGATISVVGISMGGAVAITAFASDRPPAADRLVLSGPGLRGWGALPLSYRVALWGSAHLRPGWVVRPPRRVVTVVPSDNNEMLRRNFLDPMMQKTNRIDQVFGVVTLMENAHNALPKLPENTLLLYGAKDQVIPPAAMKRSTPKLPAHVRTAYYENGYHMILRDLQAETVWTDQLAFIRDPDRPLPSGAPELPWRAKTDTAH